MNGARWASSLLAAIGLAGLALSTASAETTQEKALYDAAKKEGAVSWYSGILDQPICDQVGKAFQAKYPGIQVSAIKTTSQVAFQRLLQDLKAGQVQSDVFTTTDIGHMMFLKSKDQLVKYVPENEAGMVDAVKNVDPDGYFHTSWVGISAIVYNTAKVKPADAPKDWPDLTDPRWKGQITFGSPNYSGMVGVWTVAMENRYGWDYFTKLNALDPQIGRSIDDAVTVLNSGERIVGMGNAASALRSAAKGNPLAVVYPSSGTLIVISPSAIIKGTPHPNAAKLFMEFLTGPDYSKILAANFEQPLRGDVAPAAGGKSLADMKPFAPTADQIEKQLPPNKAKWRDTFGM
ncbi:ABC transporter substrate-binding protein [Aliidongia dinghuensis]|uniref:ABC transporter substrate-binding protein n=1 Tax=Aliidongia dinghuensis TaxID=1867774 RepID=A0A8J3E345_9PROT|nr:extracellular solute-binding protein [Aliidongia dinghuensis]GGF15566.1 ABC transporter substrate-binding protein [Aliidongia dinghuensis]